MPKFNFHQIAINLCLSVFVFCLPLFGQSTEEYYKLLDSADFYIDTNTEKAQAFLNAIPKPIEQSISGRLATYYGLQTIIYDEFNAYAKYHQSAILAIKYAEKENNFCVAGDACIGLFSNLYFIEKDTTAVSYLEKARNYYKKCDYEHGLLDVEQVEAYAKFLDRDYEACNNFLLQRLKTYETIKDDPYYYMFALYMLTLNYINLNDFNNGHKYFNKFKTIKENPNTIKFNYLSFESAINSSFADAFFNKKQIDSTRYYLQKSSKGTKYMAVGALKDYYRLYADMYKQEGNINASKKYIDSLMLLQNQLFDNTVEASLEVNDSLAKAENELLTENRQKRFNSVLAGFLVIILLLLSLFVFIYYKKQKEELAFQAKNNLKYLKSNNEQLAIKVYGLEEYIKNLKIEVKHISRTDSIEQQKEKIKDLYKNLHINSSTLLDKSENHSDLVNELNLQFFKKIKEDYPQLNKSEIIICYYLFMGFTNKEIAVFLNVTIRSVESRRYRISKKINLDKENTTLLEYLQSNYYNTLDNNLL
ncbi:helix-turn-helix transcriptional regulator [Algibacter sp. PT7-4]|uniref:helix-turn-helix transcriptional regulator n=1 Tax=Algibacter ulvanivorans TaxID=3400999 RepID=UPI003AAD8492